MDISSASAVFDLLASSLTQPTIADLLSNLQEKLASLAPVEGLSLVKYDGSGAEPVFVGGSFGRASKMDKRVPDLSPVVEVVNRQRSEYVADTGQSTPHATAMKSYRELGIASVCYLPVACGSLRLGALAITSSRPEAFSADQLDFFSNATSCLGLAIENALARQELEIERDRLRVIADIDKAIVGKLSVDELLGRAVEAMRRASPASGFTIGLRAAEGTGLELRAVSHPGQPPSFERTSWPVEGTPLGIAYSTGQPQSFDAAAFGEFSPALREVVQDFGFRFACSAPLWTGRRKMGAMSIWSSLASSADSQLMSMLTDIGPRIALAIDSAMAYEQLEGINRRLQDEKVYLQAELQERSVSYGLIGNSVAIREVIRQVDTVGPTEAIVLILGETGVGKERVAKAIHKASRRYAGPYITVNCAAIPGGLIESELFGHEKGAFTGAIERKPGRFELAQGGTLFLDEIGEIPLELQPKLLRVLQEREFERLGSTRTLSSDARIIAATNRDLAQMVEQGRFREDLFYRLNVFPLRVPPLRERPEDVFALATQFAADFGRREGKHFASISLESLAAMKRYAWPGNVRELQNVVERFAILSQGDELRIPVQQFRPSATSTDPGPKPTLDETERQAILVALRECRGRVSGPGGAAERLEINRTTLLYRMKKLGIRRADYPTNVE